MKALRWSVDTLWQFPVYPFFGTLLGLTRSGETIQGDDDVDLYLEKSHLPGVVASINQSQEAQVTFIDLESPYLEFRLISLPDVPVEIYFYEERSNHIVEKWNFAGTPSLPFTWLTVPRRFFEEGDMVWMPLLGRPILMPAQSESLCGWLYGRDWNTPKEKGVDYKTVVILGKPFQLTGVAARLHSQLSKLIWRTLLKNSHQKT